MHYFHKENMTRSRKWRIAIIIIEFLVLVLAIVLSRFETQSAVESIVQIAAATKTNYGSQSVYISQNSDGKLHGLAFYVDYHNRVRLIDAGIMQEFAQFGDCPVSMLHSEQKLGSFVTFINLASIRRGVMFVAEQYEVVVSDTTVTLLTSHNEAYQMVFDCHRDRNSLTNSTHLLPEMQSGSK